MIPYAQLAIAGVLVAFGAMQTVRLTLERNGHAKTKLEQAQQVAAWEKTRADGEAKQRQREAELQAAVDLERIALEDAKKANEELAGRLGLVATHARSLRDKVLAHASRPSTDPAEAARLVTAYGALLARGVELVGESRDLAIRCSRDHDQRAEEVAALLKAWPR